MLFTVEELTLLDIYWSLDIEYTKKEIQKALAVITDADMVVLAKSVLSKLDTISFEEYSQLDFTIDLSYKNLDTADV
jgi:hypothetical protein